MKWTICQLDVSYTHTSILFQHTLTLNTLWHTASGNPADSQGLGGSHLSLGMGGGPGRYGDDASGFGDSARSLRPEVPFPKQAPYTAFVGNLTFETVEADIHHFFNGLEVSSGSLSWLHTH